MGPAPSNVQKHADSVRASSQDSLSDTVDALLPRGTSPPDSAALKTASASAEQQDAGPDSMGSATMDPTAAGASDSSGLLGAMFTSSISREISTFPVVGWDRYEFLSLLGQGGMGAVYKARDRRIQRLVALKFIRGGDERMTLRLLQEARAQARIDHRGVCKVLEVGEVEGKAYIAMQLVEGRSLQHAYADLSLMQKVRIVRDVAEALDAAHRLGIIHRDIKPANIMVEPAEDGEPQPILMDFGLARDTTEGTGVTESGTVLGTAAFMSPEQARGEVRKLDRRTDVYSLGATLYYILAGQPPFKADSMADTLLKVILDEPPRLRLQQPSLPEALETLVGKCLAKEPSQRYASAAELAADLTRFLENRRIVGRKVSLYQRLAWKAKHNRPLAISMIALCLTLIASMSYGIRNYILNLGKERLAKRQAELAQRLGQEMGDMEWLLRTARGLPLHDLSREKNIVRQRMQTLQSELSGFGKDAEALAHYALGRGHMGMHEYAEALRELDQAIALGFQHPDAYYALGVVLGKHYEQAMYEARLAGGGDWARKRLQEIEPKYLRPALSALQRARTQTTGSPEYLDGLIAYYQQDFAKALAQAAAALQRAPWLHEASKLAGDVHLERALQARESGQDPLAEAEFAAAVQSYSEAAEVGSSDGEVYEGLAEAWVRQLEMATQRGKPAPTAYAAAVAASEKIRIAEPGSVSGSVKTAYASLMSLGFAGTGNATAERSQKCLSAAEDALRRQPNHPYASDVAAACYAMEAYRVQGAGQDPEPLLRKALSLLEPAVAKAPYFLWGLNDLGNVYLALSNHLQLHGQPTARAYFSKAVNAYSQAVKLDPSYQIGYVNILSIYIPLVPALSVESELESALAEAREVFKKCTALNDKNFVCHNNYFQICTAAAGRLLDWGKDPAESLRCGFETLETARKLGASGLDTEQADVALQLAAAKDQLRRGHDPTQLLKRAAEALPRCFSFAAQDAICRGLDAQLEWVRGEWQSQHGESALPTLLRALDKARAATHSPETNPAAWWTLAETHRRLARHSSVQGRSRSQHIEQGLAAVGKLFEINPNHARGWAVKGALELAHVQDASDSADEWTGRARSSLARALKHDPVLPSEYLAALAQAGSPAGGLSDGGL